MQGNIPDESAIGISAAATAIVDGYCDEMNQSNWCVQSYVKVIGGTLCGRAVGEEGGNDIEAVHLL